MAQLGIQYYSHQRFRDTVALILGEHRQPRDRAHRLILLNEVVGFFSIVDSW
jgi:hypothetical protein